MATGTPVFSVELRCSSKWGCGAPGCPLPLGGGSGEVLSHSLPVVVARVLGLWGWDLLGEASAGAKLTGSTPTLGTSPATIAVQGGGYSSKAAQRAWCSAPPANAALGVECPGPLQPQPPGQALGSLHSLPLQLSLGATILETSLWLFCI